MTDEPDTSGPRADRIPPGATCLFDVLGRRWAPQVLYLLGRRPARFNQLQRALPGLSSASLAERLRALAEAGLVERRVIDGPPVSTLYATTARGRAVSYHLAQMAD